MNDPINFGYCFLRFDILNDFELNDFEKFDVTQFRIQYVFVPPISALSCYTNSIVEFSSSTTIIGVKPQELAPRIFSLRYGRISKVRSVKSGNI
jgi:hypothetical protein